MRVTANRCSMKGVSVTLYKFLHQIHSGTLVISSRLTLRDCSAKPRTTNQESVNVAFNSMPTEQNRKRKLAELFCVSLVQRATVRAARPAQAAAKPHSAHGCSYSMIWLHSRDLNILPVLKLTLCVSDCWAPKTYSK